MKTAARSPEAARCAAHVPSRGRTSIPPRCKREARRDGYCSFHHPDAVARRSAQSRAAWEARAAARANRESVLEAERRERWGAGVARGFRDDALVSARKRAADVLVELVEAARRGTVVWPTTLGSETASVVFSGASILRAAFHAADVLSTFEPGYSPDDEARRARERRP